MIRCLLIAWCALFSLFAFSQDELMPVFKSGKWAAVDTNLLLVTGYEYDDLSILNGNLICARVGHYYGVLNKTHEVLLPFDYEQIKSGVGGFLIVRKKGLWGISSVDGSSVVNCTFKNIKIPKPEIAILEAENGWYLYHLTNKTKSDTYDTISEVGDHLLLVEKDDKKKLYNCLNENFSDEYTEITEKRPNLFFCTDKNLGKFVLTAESHFNHYKTNRLSFISIGQGHYAYSVNDSLRIFNTDGNLQKVIKATSIKQLNSPYLKRSLGSFFNEGYYIYEDNGKMGLLTASFQKLINAEYDEINLNDSLFCVYKNRRVGLISKDGQLVLPAKYNSFRAVGDFWLVSDNYNWGVALPGGKEIIKPQYKKITLAFGNKFIAYKGGKTGILNSSGITIYPFKKQIITVAGKCFIVERDSLFGLIGINGNSYFSPKYKELKELNSDYFAYTENKKVGIISTTGNIIIKAQFRNIFPTLNANIFFTESFKYNYQSLDDIRRNFSLDIFIPKSDIRKRRYKVGMINIYGQKLLESNYFNEQINADFQGNTIIVKRESSVLVVSFEENGKLIDKTSYKNYVFVKPAYLKNERNYWDIAGKDRKLYYGLFSPRGRTIIDYRFKTILSRFLNHPDLVRTTSPGGRFGIVNERTGKTILEDVYKVIFTNDLQKANVIRCVKSSGRASLIDSTANVLIKGIAYIDDFQHVYARVNKGGKLTYDNDFVHKLFINQENSVVPKRKEGQEGRDIICQRGKWGVIDTNGVWLIKPRYQFLQSYANGVFIAQKEIKWGVITPNDEVLIDFMYDEIRYFSGSKEGEWASIPYFKVRVKDKWGVVDAQGNKVVPVKYSGVEYLISKGRIYFKTIHDNRKVLFGLANKSGELVLQPKYEFIDQFKEGAARLKLDRKKWKYLDKHMQVFPETSFVAVKDFCEGYAAVKTRRGWGFIDKEGKQIIPCQYMDVGNFNEGLAKAKIYIPAKMLGLIKSKRVYALIDKSGKVFYNTNSKYCSDVSNGKIVIKKGRKFQVVTTKGKNVLPGSYDQITGNPKYGLYAVKVRGKGAALYNEKAQLIVPFGKYNNFSGFSEGLCYVSGKESGFIDTKGVMKIALMCKDARDFHEGVAAVKLEKGWGYIDSVGNKVTNGQYIFVWDFKNGTAKVKDKDHNISYINKKGQKTIPKLADDDFCVFSKNGFKGIINKTGHWKIYPVANEIGLFKDDYVPVGIRKQYGLYTSNGKLLVEPQYMIIEPSSKGLIKMINLKELKYLAPGL